MRRHPGMTRIAQPEQMAAVEMGAASEAHVQKKRRRTPNVSAAATNPTTTLPGNQPKLPDKIIHCTAPPFGSRTTDALRTDSSLSADSSSFQQC